MIVLFLISFCSFCYQSLAAKMIYLYLQDDTLSFAIASSIFFLGLSRGNYICVRAAQKLSLQKLKYSLVSNELSVVISACRMGLYFSAAAFLLAYLQSHLPNSSLETCQMIVAGIGIFSLRRLGFTLGKELGLSFMVSQNEAANEEKSAESGEQKKQVGSAIAWTYFGGMVASALCAFWFFKQINPIQFIWLPCALNLLLAVYFSRNYLNESTRLEKIKVAGQFFLSVALLSFLVIDGNSIYTKGKYLIYDLGAAQFQESLAERLRRLQNSMQINSKASDFQVIDWVTYLGNPVFSRLYLDGAFQFDSVEQESYHEPFWRSGLYFSKTTPQKVLIMGGGDLLLASKILDDSNINNISAISAISAIKKTPKITLVELDPLMPEMAISFWHQLEKSSLRKVNLVTADAFGFLRGRRNSWDAIFLDFPDPRSADLSKLYSVEFYSMVLKNLADDGFVVLDYPTHNSPQVIFSTLQAAGFKTVFLYGKGNTFVYADAKPRTSEEIFQLTSQSPYPMIDTPQFEKKAVNSVFELRLPEEKTWAYLKLWWQNNSHF